MQIMIKKLKMMKKNIKVACIMQIMIKKTTNEEKQVEHQCNIANCYLTERHERAKNYYSMNKERNNKLFFIKNDNNDNESDEKLIVIQDMLDTMHYYINHCIRIDFVKLLKD
eukprot:544952_1